MSNAGIPTSKNTRKIAALVTAAVIAAGGGIAYVSTENVAYPEDFWQFTTDGGAKYTLPDGGPIVGIDGGVLPPEYPYDGTVNTSGAIQAAANAMAKSCGTVKLRPVAYLFGSLVTVPPCVHIECASTKFDMAANPAAPVLDHGTVLLSSRTTQFEFFKLGNNSSVKHCTFDAASSAATYPTVGKAIDFAGTYGVELEDLTFHHAATALSCRNAAWESTNFVIQRVNILNISSTNYGIDLRWAVHGKIEDVVLMNLSYPGYGYGIGIADGSATLYLNKIVFQSINSGIRINGGAAGLWTRMADDIHITDCTFDALAGANSIAIYGSNWTHSSVIGSLFGSSNSRHVWLTDATADVKFIGNTFGQVNLTAFTLAHASLSGILIDTNNFTAIAPGGGGNAIDAVADVGHFSVTNNTFRLTDPHGLTGAFPYNLAIASGAGDYIKVLGNTGTGATGTISNNATGIHNEIQTVW